MKDFVQISELKMTLEDFAIIVAEVKECREKNTSREYWQGHIYSKFRKHFASRNQVKYVLEKVENFLDMSLCLKAK